MKHFLEIANTPLTGLGLAARLVLRSILCVYLPFIQIENEDHLEGLKGPIVFVFNHNNSFETVLIASYLLFKRHGDAVRFVVDWMWESLPFVGWFIRQVDPILVFNKRAKIGFLERGRKQRSSIPVWDQVTQTLAESKSVGLFPEGKRNQDPENLRTGRTGIGRIAIESRAPVLPIGIDFPVRIRTGRIPKIGRIIFRIGPKIEFTEEIEAVETIVGSTRLSKKSKEKLRLYFDKRVVHKVMNELARLSGKSYPFGPPTFPRLADCFFLNT